MHGSTLRIAIYVENMLVANEATPQGRALRKTFITDFAKRFNIEVIGTPTRFLGMEIERTADTLPLKQSSYISKAADKFLSGSSTHTQLARRLEQAEGVHRDHRRHHGRQAPHHAVEALLAADGHAPVSYADTPWALGRPTY